MATLSARGLGGAQAGCCRVVEAILTAGTERSAVVTRGSGVRDVHCQLASSLVVWLRMENV